MHWLQFWWQPLCGNKGVTYRWYELPVFILMGFIGGILGAIFNQINIKLTRFRNAHVKKSYLSIIECLLVASMSAVIGFILMYYVTHDCQPIGRDLVSKYPVQLFCDDGQYNAMAGLFFQTPEQSVRSLFHDPPGICILSHSGCIMLKCNWLFIHHYEGSFNPYTLVLFCLTYFLLATWTYGLAIPSGLFIPSLLIGAAWGRLVGILIAHMLPESVSVGIFTRLHLYICTKNYWKSQIGKLYSYVFTKFMISFGLI